MQLVHGLAMRNHCDDVPFYSEEGNQPENHEQKPLFKITKHEKALKEQSLGKEGRIFAELWPKCKLKFS